MASKKKASKAELSRRGRASRRKGKVYERDVAKALQRVYPHAKRGIGQSRVGAEFPDVINTSFWVECGAGNAIQIPVKLRQALADSACSDHENYGGKPAVVFTRTTRGEHVVSMEREQFIDLVAELEQLREQVRSANGKTVDRPRGGKAGG